VTRAAGRDTAGAAPEQDGLAPEAADLLRRLSELGLRPYEEIGVLRARQAVEASRWMQGERPDGVTTRDVLVAGGGGRLPARVYHPGPGRTDSPSLRSPELLPLTVWFHGGGWVTGSIAFSDGPCRAIARAARSVVVSVEYRRAPETPFPGPVDDAVAATRWLAEHAAELGADASRVIVAGDSAGGNLAAAVARRARDHHLALDRQVLVYPALAPPDPVAHPSYERNAQGSLLTRADMTWFWQHYLDPHDLGGQEVATQAPPDAAPLLADDLAGLAPASIAVAGYDPLHDEGAAYVDRLRAAGVEAHVRDWPDMIHGFLGMAGELPQAGELIAWIVDELRRTES
jgi:acetyl esterase